MNYARALRITRAARGMNQQVLAKRAGTVPSYVSMIERSHRVPTLEKIESLCQALEVPVVVFQLLACDVGEIAQTQAIIASATAVLTWIATAKDESQC